MPVLFELLKLCFVQPKLVKSSCNPLYAVRPSFRKKPYTFKHEPTPGVVDPVDYTIVPRSAFLKLKHAEDLGILKLVGPKGSFDRQAFDLITDKEQQFQYYEDYASNMQFREFIEWMIRFCKSPNVRRKQGCLVTVPYSSTPIEADVFFNKLTKVVIVFKFFDRTYWTGFPFSTTKFNEMYYNGTFSLGMDP